MKRTTLTILTIALLLFVPTLVLAQTDAPEPMPTLEPAVEPVEPAPIDPPFTDLVPDVDEAAGNLIGAIVAALTMTFAAVISSPLVTVLVNFLKQPFPNTRPQVLVLIVSSVAVAAVWLARTAGFEDQLNQFFAFLVVVVPSLGGLLWGSQRVYEARKDKDSVFGYNANPAPDDTVELEINYHEYDDRPRG